MSAYSPLTKVSAYSAAKAALIGATKALAQEVAKKRITVNAVAPGVILTDMRATVEPDILEEMRGQTPVGRNGTPMDVAALIWEKSDFLELNSIFYIYLIYTYFLSILKFFLALRRAVLVLIATPPTQTRCFCFFYTGVFPLLCKLLQLRHTRFFPNGYRQTPNDYALGIYEKPVVFYVSYPPCYT